MLRNLDWQLVTEFSGQYLGNIFKGQAVQLDTLKLKENTSQYNTASSNERNHVLETI